MHLGLVRELIELVKSGKTGVLEVKSEDARTRVYLAAGNVVFVDEGTVGETLGRILTREKVLSEEDYERVLEEMGRAREAGERARFGEIVVKLGVLTREQVDAALAAQVQHKLLACLKWADASFEFTAKPLPPEVARFPTQVEPVVIKAMRLMTEDVKNELLVDKSDAKPKLKTDVTRVTGLFGLKTPETRFVRMLDGKMTVSQLLDTSQPDAVDPELLLCVLTLTGHVSYDAVAKPAGPPRPPAVPKRKKKEEKAPPSSKRPQRTSALRSKVLRLTQSERRKIKLAAERLGARKGMQRAPTPPSLTRISASTEEGAKLLAEQHFRRGRLLLRKNKLPDALASLKRAVDLVPNATEYRLYAAWASFRLLPEKEADRSSALRAIAKRAIREDAGLGFGYYVLGHIALREGNTQEAEEMLGRARRLDSAGIDGEKPLTIAAVKAPQKPRPPVSPLVPKHAAALSPPMAMKETPHVEDMTKPNAIASAIADVIAGAAEMRDAKGTADKPAPPPVKSPKQEEAAPVAAAATTPAPEKVEPKTDKPKTEAKPTALVDAKPKAPEKKRGTGKAIIAVAIVGIAAIAAFAMKDRLGATTTPATTTTRTSTSTSTATATANPTSTPTSTATSASTSTSTATSTSTSTATSTPTATTSASAPASASPLPSASASASASPSASASAIAPASASASASSPVASDSASASGTGTGTGTGTIIPPSWAQGRRVFIDGKVAGEAPAPIDVPCGSHVVQVGSSGKPRTVDVPCGGKLEL